MVTTLADPRLTLWQTRATTIRDLAAMRVQRAHRCGLPCCADHETNNGSLDARIKITAKQVADMTEQLSRRETPCTF